MIKKKLNSLGEEEITKKKKIQKRVCLWSTIVSLVALVCIIDLWSWVVSDINSENYNEQFTQYIKENSSYWWESKAYVSNVEGVINSAIENNRSGRKVTLVYQNINYTSADELKQLSSKLDTSKKYSIEIEYYNNYIETITLSSYVAKNLEDFLSFEGNNQSTREVIPLIHLVQNKVANHNENKINITYTDETDQTRTVNVSTDNSQEIANLIQEIKASKKTYTVEIKTDLDDTCNIIIICNNNNKEGVDRFEMIYYN